MRRAPPRYLPRSQGKSTYSLAACTKLTEGLVRRIIDGLLGFAALVCLSPLFVVIVTVIFLDSPGSPFHGGWRIGRNGRRFRMWKFRTMVPHADRIGPQITAWDDPRVTRMGNFLRRSKLDELPQFLNVLLGDMSLVGPRPEVPEIVDGYSPKQREILSVKPGITGPGQLAYTEEKILDSTGAQKYYLTHLLDPKLRLELDYIRTRTPATDFLILLKTAVLMARRVAQLKPLLQ